MALAENGLDLSGGSKAGKALASLQTEAQAKEVLPHRPEGCSTRRLTSRRQRPRASGSNGGRMKKESMDAPGHPSMPEWPAEPRFILTKGRNV